MASLYGHEGADELTFLDISASVAGRETTLDVVRKTAEQVFIPLTVGGGIRSVDDVDRLLRAGADKVSINTAALSRPELIAEIADRFGSQVLVLSVDARRANTESGFEVTTHGGRESAGVDALAWVEKACALGVGEILLNSMDADGTRAGYDIGMISAVRAVSKVPLIASGGAGTLEDFASALDAGADALLAASVFHFGCKEVPLGPQLFSAQCAYGLRQNTHMSRELSPEISALLKDPAALIPAVAQDVHSGEVLMLAYVNAESLAATLATGRATYWSRSRNELWEKGATSGHTQLVHSIALDCDGDALLIKVEQTGAACHTGDRSCFHRNIEIAQ
jgi:imidazoleglycerol phosphate synthase cyclase subunit